MVGPCLHTDGQKISLIDIKLIPRTASKPVTTRRRNLLQGICFFYTYFGALAGFFAPV
jgi:hypothetical protein